MILLLNSKRRDISKFSLTMSRGAIYPIERTGEMKALARAVVPILIVLLYVVIAGCSSEPEVVEKIVEVEVEVTRVAPVRVVVEEQAPVEIVVDRSVAARSPDVEATVEARVTEALATRVTGTPGDRQGEGRPAFCGGPADRDTRDAVSDELHGRSFRQFDPSMDAGTRRGVILDFSDGFRMWAQYSEAGHALNEWEIGADEYFICWNGDVSEVTLVPTDPSSTRLFPHECSDCIATSGISVSVRNLLDGETAFRVNDPYSVLPLPSPVFDSWTGFVEDEYVE